MAWENWILFLDFCRNRKMLKAKKDTKDLAQIIKITLQGKITSLSAQKDDGEEEKRRERKKWKEQEQQEEIREYRKQ